MRVRYAAIGLSTALVLILGLPALGDVTDVYRIGWGAAGEAYTTHEGACGHIESFEPPWASIDYCFGDTIDVRWQPHGGEVQRVAFWLHASTCDDLGCSDETIVLERPDVTHSIGPLLDAASVSAAECGSGTLDLSMVADAESEPSLGHHFRGSHHDVQSGPGGGSVTVVLGGSAGSIGRQAGIDPEGTTGFCGYEAFLGDLQSGQIYRGLGSEGASAEVRYISG